MLLEGILGTVTGLIGTTVGGVFKYKEKKLEIEKTKIDNDHELKVMEAETKAIIAEAEANIKITEAQVEGAVELKEADAFIQSQKEGNKKIFNNKWIDGLLSIKGKWRWLTFPVACIISFLFGFVDFLKEFIRPSLTIYLCILSTYITWMAWKIMQTHGINITGEEAVNIFKDVCNIILYLTISAVSWYYGDRRLSKNIMEMKTNRSK